MAGIARFIRRPHDRIIFGFANTTVNTASQVASLWRRPKKPFLARAREVFTRQQQQASSSSLFYFEVFVKTTGGGLQPTGSVGVGLASPDDDDDSTTFFTHYHSSGRRHPTFPRLNPRAGKPCGPSFGVGDTIGCGWLPSGEVFFTVNGRHLGVAFGDVWGALCPAVDVDSPGACLELTTGRDGQRRLKYQPPTSSGGASRTGSGRWLQRMLPAKLADAAAERVDKMAAQAHEMQEHQRGGGIRAEDVDAAAANLAANATPPPRGAVGAVASDRSLSSASSGGGAGGSAPQLAIMARTIGARWQHALQPAAHTRRCDAALSVVVVSARWARCAASRAVATCLIMTLPCRSRAAASAIVGRQRGLARAQLWPRVAPGVE